MNGSFTGAVDVTRSTGLPSRLTIAKRTVRSAADGSMPAWRYASPEARRALSPSSSPD